MRLFSFCSLSRPPWSSRGGQKSLPRESFRLLDSSYWKWDTEWKLTEILDGQPTEKGKWRAIIKKENFRRLIASVPNASNHVWFKLA